MVAKVDITVQSDGDFYQLFQYTLADGLTAIPIIGATFNMGVRRTAQDAAVLFRVTSALSSSGQISPFDAPNGKFVLWIAKSVLQTAPIGIWVQSLIVNLPAAGPQPAIAQPIWNGAFTINPGPSR